MRSKRMESESINTSSASHPRGLGGFALVEQARMSKLGVICQIMTFSKPENAEKGDGNNCDPSSNPSNYYYDLVELFGYI